MDITETQATLGRRHRMEINKAKPTTHRTKKLSNTDHTKNWDQPRCLQWV